MKKKYEPLDLSRRCDSVDTMKTPSPCSIGENSPSPCSIEENSPSIENSPTNTSAHHNDSAAYSAHLLPRHSDYQQSLQDFSNAYSCQQKRDTPSPDIEYYRKPHNEDSKLTPYMIQAKALQQRLSQHSPPVEDDSSETGSLNKQHLMNSYPMQLVVGRDGKLSRPFKAYPRDPLSIASFSVGNAQSAEKFEIFRLKMLKHIHAANGGNATISNPKMRRTASRAGSTHTADGDSITNNNNSDSSSGLKDSAYYERRKKNNAAAKKSRDRRRIKEDEIAIRATFLENENRECQAELVSNRNQMAELKLNYNAMIAKLTSELESARNMISELKIELSKYKSNFNTRQFDNN